MKKLLWILAIIALLIFVLTKNKKEDNFKSSSSPAVTQPIKNDPPPKTPAQILQEEKDFYKMQLRNLQRYKIGNFPKDLNGVRAEIIVLDAYAGHTIKANTHKDDSIKQIGQNMENLLKSIQMKEFPILRKTYVEVSKAELWVNDIDVSGSGTNTTCINYAGHIFAANANKQDFQDKLHAIMNELRFKKSTYRWYKGADEYTYYTIDSPNDGDIVVL